MMDADALKRLQAPLKDAYRANAEAAKLTLRASASLDDAAVSCRVETGRAVVRAGLHPMSGGDGTLACSGDMLLQALAACAGVTLRAVATSLDVDISGEIRVEGDLDFRGTLGVDKAAPVGFTAIRITFALSENAPRENLQKVVQLTERYCVVLQTLSRGVPVVVSHTFPST
jgi:uncharacterized OsmC-like protein